MADTTMRHLHMLRLLPRYPQKRTVPQIHEALQSIDFDIDRRSVERDLVRLSQHVPISSDPAGRPRGWFWMADAPDVIAPGLEVGEALGLELLGRYLHALLPISQQAALTPRLRAARAALDTLAPPAIARWRKRVTVIDDGAPLVAPEVPADALAQIHAGLLHGRCLEADYLALGARAPRRYRVHPLALVYSGRVGYLVAMLDDFEDARHLALHRVRSARVTEAAARDKADFDLDAYLRSHAFDLPGEAMFRLELRVSERLARFLEERRLSSDQRIEHREGGIRVLAQVRESERLVWWLRSQGTEVEVIRPLRLRRRLAQEFQALADAYRGEAT
jgi:predicted DNA-binding transcriptional regulator YafY